METIFEKFTRSNSRGPSFDLLRLFAATMVVYAHSFLVTGDKDYFWCSLFPGIDAGAFAVSVFFAASGYMVTESLRRNDSYKIFLYKRAIRIFPALMVVVLISTFIVGAVFTTQNRIDYYLDAHTSLYLVSAFFPLQQAIPSVFSDGNSHYLNGNLWTLRYETICYAILAIAGRRLFVYKFISLYLCAGAITLTAIELLLSHELREMRWFATIVQCTPLFAYFFGGATVSVLSKHILIKPSFIITSFVIVICSMRIGYYNLLFPLFGSYLIANLGLSRVLDSSALQAYRLWGDFSYGVYITSFPVQQLVVREFGGNWISNFMCSMPIVLILSFISWHFLEKKCLALKYRPVPR